MTCSGARRWQPTTSGLTQRRGLGNCGLGNCGLGNWRLIRYADDFVVMVSGRCQYAQVLREEVAGDVCPIGVTPVREKTRVVHIDEGFEFLGFHIRRRRKRGTQKRCVYTVPSKGGRPGGQGHGAAQDE